MSDFSFQVSYVLMIVRTNVPDCAMALLGSPFPYGPFVPHWVPKQSIQNYFSKFGLDPNLSLNTTVEHLVHIPRHRWRLTLRKHRGTFDEWWEEEFDAVVVANGHYAVPYVRLV
jgi:cation diffusion facilitator CzcD-associated flavoprotein CzcO